MTRRRTVVLFVAATIPMLLLPHLAMRQTGDVNPLRAVRPSAPDTGTASRVAVQFVHAMTDDHSRVATAVISATSTPALAASLLDASEHAHQAAAPTVLDLTSVDTRAIGADAAVRITGELTTSFGTAAVAWTLRLLRDQQGRWRVQVVS